MNLRFKRPVLALSLGALMLASLPAAAQNDMLRFLPPNAEIVVGVNFDALPKGDPQLDGIISQIDTQMRADAANPADVPSLKDMSSFAAAFVIDDTGTAEPEVFAAAKTNNNFASLSNLAAAEGASELESNGRKYYVNDDMAFSVAPSNDMVLISDSVVKVDQMMSAYDGNNVTGRSDVTTSSNKLSNPFLTIHVNGPETISPQVAGFKMQAQGLAMMGMAQVPPDQQAAVQGVANVIPHIFEAQGYNIFAGFEGEQFVVHVMGDLASPEAASATASAFDGMIKSAGATDPQAKQMADRSSVSSNGNAFDMSFAMPKQEAIQGLQMAMGMAMMQAAQMQGGGGGY